MIIGKFGARFIVKDSTAVVLEVGVSIKVDGVWSIFVDGISIDISRNLLVSTDGGDNFGFVKSYLNETHFAMYIPRLSICLFSWTVTVSYCAAMLEEDEHYDEQICPKKSGCVYFNRA